MAAYEYDGSAWKEADFPTRTCAIAGTSNGLAALTSDSDLWLRTNSDSEWRLLSQLDGVEYASSLLVVGDQFILGGKYLLVIDGHGREVFRQEGAPVFQLREIADHVANTVIVLGGRNDCWLLNAETLELQEWNQGIPRNQHPGFSSIARHGDGYLATSTVGVYEWNVDERRWARFVDPLACEDAPEAMWVTRGIGSLEDGSGRWLIADNCGIHLMDAAGRRIKRIDPGSDQHSLIENLVRHEGYFYVSFYRLSSGVVGGRLSIEDFEYETIMLNPTGSP